MVDRRYYKKQDELISVYEGIHLDNCELDSESARVRLRRQATRLAKLSFFMNFVSRLVFRHSCTVCGMAKGRQADHRSVIAFFGFHDSFLFVHGLNVYTCLFTRLSFQETLGPFSDFCLDCFFRFSFLWITVWRFFRF